jgi:hypothetical protein
MARGGMGDAAERWIVERIRALPDWDAHNANHSRLNQPGFDVLATNSAGHQLRVSVKSVSTGGTRHDYGIGRSFARHPADIYAFVDLTRPTPWPVYLAGGRTVEELALVRHRRYQADRGRTEGLNTWAPKVSLGLLEAMGAREAWDLLSHPTPTTHPPVTDALRRHAERDAPRPRDA